MSTQALRPSYAGVYPMIDASLFIKATTPQIDDVLQLSTRHLYRWVKEGLAGEYLEGLRGKEVSLTFLDLVTMRIVAIFRTYGVKPREIKIAYEALAHYGGWTHPFAMEPVWVYGPDIYIKAGGVPIAISRYWQGAFDFISEYLKPVHNLLFDDQEQAASWEPKPGILLDPKLSFGSPCVKGTRISTESLWALNSAGDSISLIAESYELSSGQVEASIAWEEDLERIAA